MAMNTCCTFTKPVKPRPVSSGRQRGNGYRLVLEDLSASMQDPPIASRRGEILLLKIVKVHHLEMHRIIIILVKTDPLSVEVEV